jgi:beta-phosphoglucomutase-like phosphatase (HAD superfamily)
VAADIRAGVFDLDGVLLDTERILRQVDAEALARYGAMLAADVRQRTLGMTHEAKDRLFGEEPRWACASPVRARGLDASVFLPDPGSEPPATVRWCSSR